MDNGGAPGTDGMTVEELVPYCREHWARIREELLSGTYVPAPVRRVDIPKPGGRSTRTLGIPTVMDRMIQQALLQVLTPIFDPTFSDDSYGFRPGRSAHQAVLRARDHVAAGHRWVADLDIEKFFDRGRKSTSAALGAPDWRAIGRGYRERVCTPTHSTGPLSRAGPVFPPWEVPMAI